MTWPTTLQQVQRRLVQRDMARRIRQPITIELPADVLASGCEFRELRQIPVMFGPDSTVRNVVGSAHHLRLSAEGFHAEIRWASDFDASRIRERFESGEMTIELRFMPLTECQDYNGNSINAKWQPLRLDLVAG